MYLGAAGQGVSELEQQLRFVPVAARQRDGERRASFSVDVRPPGAGLQQGCHGATVILEVHQALLAEDREPVQWRQPLLVAIVGLRALLQ